MVEQRINSEVTSVGIEPTTSGLDLPLLCRLSYEVGQLGEKVEDILAAFWNHGEEK